MAKSCKECPWKVDSIHNKKWKNWIQNLVDSGWRKNKVHNCHMIAPVWDKITEKTKCQGSCENQQKQA